MTRGSTAPAQSLFSQKLSTKRKVDHAVDLQKTLDPESYRDFMEALKNIAISAPVLRATLKECGYVISPSTLSRWRKQVTKGSVK